MYRHNVHTLACASGLAVPLRLVVAVTLLLAALRAGAVCVLFLRGADVFSLARDVAVSLRLQLGASTDDAHGCRRLRSECQDERWRLKNSIAWPSISTMF